VACTRIQKGKGVCGAAVEKKKTMLVPDVHAFEGHIACDSESNSELVIPIIVKGVVLGVLDLDSVVVDGFDQTDQEGLEKIVHLIEASWQWDQLMRIVRPVSLKGRKSPNRTFSYVGFGIVFLSMVAGALYMVNFAPSWMYRTSGSKGWSWSGKGSGYTPSLSSTVKTLKS